MVYITAHSTDSSARLIGTGPMGTEIHENTAVSAANSAHSVTAYAFEPLSMSPPHRADLPATVPHCIPAGFLPAVPRFRERPMIIPLLGIMFQALRAVSSGPKLLSGRKIM